MRLQYSIYFAALLFATSCHNNAGSGIVVDSSFSGFIPNGTKALIGVNVDGLKHSEFFRRHVKQFNMAQLNTFSDRVGLDPARDVSEIVIAWDGKELLSLAHGSFKSEDVQQKVAKMTPEQEKYKSLVFFGTKREAVTFLPKSVALAGPSDELKKAIDEQANGGGGVPGDLQSRLRGVLPNAQLWGASQGVLPLNTIPLGSDAQSALSNLADYINGTNFGMALDSGAHLKMDISCISAEGAQRVNDALRGLIGFARLSTKDNELEMLRLWDSIQVEKTEQGVRIHADLPAELADKFVDQFAKMANRR